MPISLQQLAGAGQAGLELWLLVLAVLVGWRVLIVDDHLRGMLATHLGDGLQLDRLQMLLSMLGGAVAYAIICADGWQHALAIKELPEAPDSLLTIVAGSQAIYLGGKVSRNSLGGG
ncbi:hypothetical protein [Phenylobacterium sp.]|uniref:hypothetical protein n=1 Tax=Phenylobacterium sp. TaxID=1871053 RepID=UPI0025E5EED3|nr:hypothetical protein [Phenylobacterium sp.]